MPLQSMTGYGNGESQGKRFRAKAAVRALNHRHFEAEISIPAPFEALEPAARARTEAAFSRGKVDVTLRVEALEEPIYEIRVHRGLIEAWLRETNQLRKSLRLKDPVPLIEALRLPGAVETVPRETEMRLEDHEEILRALDVALERALLMKRAEGEALARDLSARLDGMERAVNAIAAHADEMLRLYTDKLTRRIREWSREANLALDEERLLREAAYYAERSDVAEEITRLRSHFAQFRELLASEKTDAGRALDFLAQEMHREANTLSVKARTDQITPFALDLRSDIEKLREQVRNVE